MTIPMFKTPKITREQWLEQAISLLRPLFKQAGYTVPKKVRISVGFPYGSRKWAGECWATTCSADEAHEIFVSPRIALPMMVLDVLAHELCHPVAGVKAKHGKAFKAVAVAIGLVGKMSDTRAGEELAVKLCKIVKTLGKYPHGVLTPGKQDKQTARLLKVSCPDCGYVARVTRKWLDNAGAPICPACRKPFVEDVKE